MTTQVQKWGNSLALRLPKAVAEQIDVSEGQDVEMRVERGSLVIKAVRRKYRLADLMKSVNQQNRHAEVQWGNREGGEIW